MGSINTDFTGWNALYCHSCGHRVGTSIMQRKRMYRSYEDPMYTTKASAKRVFRISERNVSTLLFLAVFVIFGFIPTLSSLRRGSLNVFDIVVFIAFFVVFIFIVRTAEKNSKLISMPATCPKCSGQMSRIPVPPSNGSYQGDEKNYLLLVKVYLWDMSRAYSELGDKETSEIRSVLKSAAERVAAEFDDFFGVEGGFDRERFGDVALAKYAEGFSKRVRNLRLAPSKKSLFTPIPTHSTRQINELVKEVSGEVAVKIFEKHGKPNDEAMNAAKETGKMVEFIFNRAKMGDIPF